VFAAFEDQVLPFDSTAATHYAEVVGGRDQIGLPIDGFDAQIASICRAKGAALTTQPEGLSAHGRQPDRPVATPVVLENPVSFASNGRCCHVGPASKAPTANGTRSIAHAPC